MMQACITAVVMQAAALQQQERKKQKEWKQQQDRQHSRDASTAGMTKEMKQATACWEDNNNIDIINMRWQQQQ